MPKTMGAWMCPLTVLDPFGIEDDAFGSVLGNVRHKADQVRVVLVFPADFRRDRRFRPVAVSMGLGLGLGLGLALGWFATLTSNNRSISVSLLSHGIVV